jgi:hypothetical protein
MKMKRQMDARGLIVLPKLDAGGATTLVDALLTRVKEEEDLSKPIADAAKRLKQSMTVIADVMRCMNAES